MKSISPEELKRMIDDDKSLHIVDVRTPAEYEEVHIKEAVNVPLSRLTDNGLKDKIRSGERIVAVCHSGSRSQSACRKLAAEGAEDIFSLEGGTSAWINSGFNVVRGGKPKMSIERQVRTIAGTLVLLGISAGFLIHQGFFFLAAFVGAGLLFSGVTDWCGMGLLLEKLPWNKKKGE